MAESPMGRKIDIVRKKVSKPYVRSKDPECELPGGCLCQAQEAEGAKRGQVLGGVDREDSRDRRRINRSRKGVDAPPQQKVLQMQFLLDSIYNLPEAAI